MYIFQMSVTLNNNCFLMNIITDLLYKVNFLSFSTLEMLNMHSIFLLAFQIHFNVLVFQSTEYIVSCHWVSSLILKNSLLKAF